MRLRVDDIERSVKAFLRPFFDASLNKSVIEITGRIKEVFRSPISRETTRGKLCPERVNVKQKMQEQAEK